MTWSASPESRLPAARAAVRAAGRCPSRAGARSRRSRAAPSTSSRRPSPSRPSGRRGCRRSSRAGCRPGSRRSATRGRSPTRRARCVPVGEPARHLGRVAVAHRPPQHRQREPVDLEEDDARHVRAPPRSPERRAIRWMTRSVYVSSSFVAEQHVERRSSTADATSAASSAHPKLSTMIELGDDVRGRTAASARRARARARSRRAACTGRRSGREDRRQQRVQDRDHERRDEGAARSPRRAMPGTIPAATSSASGRDDPGDEQAQRPDAQPLGAPGGVRLGVRVRLVRGRGLRPCRPCHRRARAAASPGKGDRGRRRTGHGSRRPRQEGDMTQARRAGDLRGRGAADAAAASLTSSGAAHGDAVGVLVLDEHGGIKTEKVGSHSAGKGAGIGLVLGLLGPVGLVAGTVGGGLLGLLHHKSLGLTGDDHDRIAAQLKGGKAAVGVLADVDEIPEDRGEARRARRRRRDAPPRRRGARRGSGRDPHVHEAAKLADAVLEVKGRSSRRCRTCPGRSLRAPAAPCSRPAARRRSSWRSTSRCSQASPSPTR